MKDINKKFVISTLAINIVLINSLCFATNHIADDGNTHILDTNSYLATNAGTYNSALVSDCSEINGSNLSLTTEHHQAAAAYVANGGKITLSDSTIFVNAAIPVTSAAVADHTHGIWATGSDVNGVSTVLVEKTDIIVQSARNHGVFAQNGGYVELKDVNINTLAYGTNALFAQGKDSTSGAMATIIADNVNIETEQSTGYGAEIRDNAQMSMSNAQITTKGTSASGVIVQVNSNANITNTSIKTSGNNAQGVSLLTNSEMALDQVTIETSGTNSHAVSIRNSSNMLINNSKIQAAGSGAHALRLEGQNVNVDVVNSALLAENHTGIIVSGKNNVINFDNSTINSGTGVILETTGDGEAYFNLHNGTMINGIIKSATVDTDKIYLAIHNNSIYTGNTENVNEINLTTSGKWIFDQDNTIGSMDNTGGIVQFDSSTYSAPLTLTTNNLSGAGNFIMQADIANLVGDLLVVNDSSAGSHTLFIANDGASATNGTEELVVVQTPDGASDFALANDVEAGGYRYRIIKDGNNWKLYSAGRLLTTSASAGVGFFNTGYLSNYIENQTLLQRLGDLRNQPEKTNTGFWIRGYGGKLNSFSGQGALGFDMAYAGTQGGIDGKVELTNADLIVGGVVGFTRGNPNYEGGSGTLKNYHAGVYATYYHDNGIYVDGLAKYNNTRNHFSVNDTAGTRVKGTGKTQGYAVSLEVGKRFMLSQAKQGVYLEPQIQATYGYQYSDQIHASNGLKVDLKNYNTTQGRAGLNLGYQSVGKAPVNIYLKGNFTREMDGRTAYKLNGNKHKYSFKSNWRSGGIGGSLNLKQNHNIYADVEYAKGGRFNQRQLNLGYSYRI
ncbi:autotransporter outer membrane beta-barrel domain-containing protein [Entomomonas asaccharolytica]|uniref:Autotransporter outer membrane beta-barrel domain-containing protein n=1 Tax=Entomomonas asaccharolytica TaxID=2785331 RepID=A0A974RXE0_9GAMM|nr:autotransporter outer membrane beta-barrel domain-containing protein [Entomomonas asaccharolytica]QQP86118.1 autotransporter outer membrane beta-barrel domain-containing protein [Entomomonas asaccharolytica]